MIACDTFVDKERISVSLFFKANPSGTWSAAIGECASVNMTTTVIEGVLQHNILLIGSYSKFSHNINALSLVQSILCIYNNKDKFMVYGRGEMTTGNNLAFLLLRCCR